MVEGVLALYQVLGVLAPAAVQVQDGGRRKERAYVRVDLRCGSPSVCDDNDLRDRKCFVTKRKQSLSLAFVQANKN